MDYSEFCRPFYVRPFTKSGLIGVGSQGKIAEFFIRAGMSEETADRLLLFSSSEFIKWFKGTRRPDEAVWEAVREEFDEAYFRRTLESALRESALPDLLETFRAELPEGVLPDRGLVAEILARQFFALAQANGAAKNVVVECCQRLFSPAVFSDYIERASTYFSSVKTLFYAAESRHLEDFYVCSRVAAYEARRCAAEAAGVSAERLLHRAGRVLLVGGSGSGKSLLMRYLFVQAAVEYPERGVLPVLIRLREFGVVASELEELILDSVRRFDDIFERRHLQKLLREGSIRLFMDGLDEVSGDALPALERQLDRLAARFPDCSCVMTSRDFIGVQGLPQFVLLRIEPFGLSQALEMAKKLEAEKEVKESFLRRLRDEYSRTHREFIGCPLLLTIMFLTYREYGNVPRSRHVLYEEAFRTLLYRHDRTDKTAFRRFFRSAEGPEGFSVAFRELGARAFLNGDYSFSTRKFEEYFDGLSSVHRMKPERMTAANLLFDAVYAVGILQKEGREFRFLHRSLQEYLFADFYAGVDPGTLQQLGRQMTDPRKSISREGSAFEMLHECAPEKVERFIIFPFLDAIFQREGREAFLLFLREGFAEVRYVVYEPEAIQQYRIAPVWSYVRGICWNRMESAVLGFVLQQCGFQELFRIPVSTELGLRYEEALETVFCGKVKEARQLSVWPVRMRSGVYEDASGVNERVLVGQLGWMDQMPLSEYDAKRPAGKEMPEVVRPQRVNLSETFVRLVNEELQKTEREETIELDAGEALMRTDQGYLPGISEEQIAGEAWLQIPQEETEGQFVRNEDGSLKVFGYEYRVDIEQVTREPERYEKLIAVLEDQRGAFGRAFETMKRYYDELKKRLNKAEEIFL